MAAAIQPSFSGGELAPALHGRTDLAKYHTGLKTCLNWFVHAQGGVSTRSGFQFIVEVKDSSRFTRLIPFSFNAEDTYALEFGHEYMRVIRLGAQVESAGSPVEIVTPYQESELRGLDFVQSADVITIVHPNHAPRELSRTSHTSWSLDLITFAPTISAPINLTSTQVVNDWLSARPYASGDIVNHNGVYYRCYSVHTSSSLSEPGVGAQWENYWVVHLNARKYKVTAVSDGGEESLPSAEYDMTSAGLLSWDAVTDAVSYYIYVETNNLYSYVGRTDTNEFQDSNIVPDETSNPPKTRVLFDAAGKYPGAVTYHEQRLAFGGSDNDPQTFWTSRTGSFHNMQVSSPSTDEDAITATLVANQVNRIKHLVSLNDLLILTAGAEWRITSFDQAFSFSNIRRKPQGYRGAGDVKPLVIGGTVLYTLPKSSVVRDFEYSLESDVYSGSDLTILSKHLFENHSVVSWAHQQHPYGIVWGVRDDGVLLGLTYQREHKVWAWHRHTTEGEFEDVISISEGLEDAVYAVIKRTIRGQTKRYIERLHTRLFDAVEDAFFVDSGLTYSGSPATTITGLEHLEGMEVVALADGNVIKGLTVLGGQVVLQHEASVVHVGLPYVCDIETLNPPIQAAYGKKRTVTKLQMQVEKTRGLWAGPNSENLYELKQREYEDWGEPTALKTGFMETTISHTWQGDGSVLIRQNDPLPASILSLIPDYELGE
ncbi:MAG: hypothetical protein DBP02_02190 [gamma proteobacterium symbiont of Ctena orbiculata]|nr:MAG: hypothetical protein DBP02_02190 [gamma proteobacterium symbiont of Ctena orbiculata]